MDITQNQSESAFKAILTRYLPDTSTLSVVLFSIFVISALVFGWQVNLSNYISAESGVGYLLGIIGGSMMLLMLLYSLRKRVHFMRRLPAAKYWFRMHMLFGVLGPVCILYHCAFSWGAVNSNVALFCMLVVAGSGLIGRYIYRQIHFGLYGKKITAEQLKQDLTHSLQELEAIQQHFPDIENKLFTIDPHSLDESHSIIKQLFNVLWFAIKGRLAYQGARKNLKQACQALKTTQGWDKKNTRQFYRSAQQRLHVYYATIRKIVGFQFFERLFALWHVLHIPLFIMMIISGVVHVFAVHLY